MRTKLAVAAVLLLAGCAKTPEGTAADTATDTGPSINVSAAPGVAFAYGYQFRLPPAKIGAAQEAHQAACERLGLAHCRITGWHYHVAGENDVQGTLSLLLDPTLARGFGKEATASVTQAGGSLADAEITGTDAGAAIKVAQGQATEAGAEIARIDRQLSRADLPRGQRETLEAQRAEATQNASAARAAITTQQASLATTPMTFDYRSGPTIRGFDGSAPITSSIDLAIASAQMTLAMILSILAVAGPPALAILAGLALYRVARRRLARAPVPPADA